MQPTAPAAAPLTSNTNLPFGGTSQSNSDARLTSNILSFLPTEEQQSARVNPSDTSILPTVNPNISTFTAPTAPMVDPRAFGTDLTGYNAAVQGAERNLTGSENDIYQQALNEYTKNISRFGNLTDVYNKLANTYNIPGYQQDINSLQGLLENLNQDVNAQTTLGGGLMTQAARDEAYANRRNPIDIALANAGRELSSSQADVNNLLGAYETSLTNALKPEELNLSNLPTLFGQTNEAAQTGFNQGATSIQDTIQNRIAQAQLAAYQKQVNAEFGNGGTVTGALGSPGANVQGGGGNGQPFYMQRPGGGYNFQDATGKAINASQYAKATKQPIGQVLYAMGQAGDLYAQQAYNQIQSNKSWYDAHPDILATEFAPLFGGQ